MTSAIQTVASVCSGRSGLVLVVQQFRGRVWVAFERGERGVALAPNEAAARAGGAVPDRLRECDRALVSRRREQVELLPPLGRAGAVACDPLDDVGQPGFTSPSA